MSPIVSVVLAANSGKDLDRAIASVRAQTLREWELIVVDDGSREGLSGPWASDARVRVVRNANNLGLAASLNRGIGESSAPLVARMDADDVCYPERLAQQVAALERHREVDVLGCQALMFRGDGEALGVMVPPEGHEAIIRGLPRGNFPLFHPAWLGRRRWFERFPYDPAYRKAQDFELLLRAFHTSRFMNLDEVLLGYRYETGSLRKRLESRKYVLRALRQHASALGTWPYAKSSALTMAKAVADVTLEGLRLHRLRERTVLREIPAGHAERWRAVWNQSTPATLA